MNVTRPTSGDKVTATQFDEWFQKVTDSSGVTPHEWQRTLAQENVPRTRLIRIPTGMGKTLGVLAAWSFHRLERADDLWPRRLVWCLPMRVLVEQTESVVRGALSRMGMLWDGQADHHGKVGVHVLMGGAEAGGDWNLHPEQCAVLIGTQDMLLSRALNRGYAAGRARWPLEFGLLSHDALWVMDEVQLMDVGLATSAQLQSFHDADIARGFRPRLTWWMSATLQPRWLRSVDTESRHSEWVRDPCGIPSAQRHAGLGNIVKTLSVAEIAQKDVKGFAERILDEHSRLPDGPYGRITLVVCNTVDRACGTYRRIVETKPTQVVVELVHSRFRPIERKAWRDRFLKRDVCISGVDRIIVATQVVEAGVDISAGCVVSELAPWPSLVQRFGRCARYGGSGHVVVIDRGRDQKLAAPYASDELGAAWDALTEVMAGNADVGTASLEDFEEVLTDEARLRLYPYEPKHLLLRRELDELFDTTPDLSGADLDISRFIRSGDERDLQVFWLDIPRPKKNERAPTPDRKRRPHREELCNVPFLRARDWLCGEETQKARKPRLKASVRAWVWDWLDGEWVDVQRSLLLPGRVVCVASNCGGYRVEHGFDPEAAEDVPVVEVVALAPALEAQLQSDASEDAEDLSETPEWKTIACHVGEVAAEARVISDRLQLNSRAAEILALAGRWHDLGKAHPAFQGLIRIDRRPDRCDLAKAPKGAWKRGYRTLDGRDARPGFRHELASALALFSVLQRHAPRHAALLGPWVEAFQRLDTSLVETLASEPPTPCEQAVLDCTADEFDLLAYLVVCHHGKVRVALHASPKDQDYEDRDRRGMPIRGVREGDVLPSVLLDAAKPALPELRLTLAPAMLGLSPSTGRSWRDRTNDLLRRYGPGGLAWLEALIIAADRRASRLSTADPVLSNMEEVSR